jgi:hypothetical protein
MLKIKGFWLILAKLSSIFEALLTVFMEVFMTKYLDANTSDILRELKDMAAAGWWVRMPTYGVSRKLQGRIFSAKQVLSMANKTVSSSRAKTAPQAWKQESFWKLRALGAVTVCFAD